jgi:hypothetical protein
MTPAGESSADAAALASPGETPQAVAAGGAAGGPPGGAAGAAGAAGAVGGPPGAAGAASGAGGFAPGPTEHRAARVAALVWVPLTLLYVHDAVTANWGWAAFVFAPLGWAGGLVTGGLALAARRDRPLALTLAASAVGWFVGAWIGASGASGC